MKNKGEKTNTSKITDRVREFEKRVSDFVSSFEEVFDHDWEMTKGCITEEFMIRESGTFLAPGVDDEFNNWGNRGALLESYRRLSEYLRSNDIR
jgi:hypothetical protein